MGALLDLLDDPPGEVNVAFVPTAGHPYEDASFVELDRRKLIDHGFDLTELDLKGRSREDLEAALADVDVVYVAGGNTFYLLEQVRASGFDELLPRLLERGVLYVGASAGAAILGPDIGPYSEFDDPDAAPALSSHSGLGLVDFLVIPHYDNKKFRPMFDELMQREGDRLEFRPLHDDQAILLDGGRAPQVIGSP
jgi:dipeptidase E